MIVFKTLIIILILTSSQVLFDSIESASSSSYESFDCDSLFIESDDSLLYRFIQRHNLEHYFERRNEGFEECIMFLNKFTSLIHKYRHEEGRHDDLKISKKASSQNRPKF